jgi:hypothetical protein
MWSRRAVLGAVGALSVLGPRSARAFGDATAVDIAELDLGEGTLSRPFAWQRLLYEVLQDTSVESSPRSVRVKPSDPELFEHPFVVLLGSGRFDVPDERSLEQLSRYLSYGGFLLIDDTTGREDSEFDDSVRDLLGRLFPTRPLARLPEDHSLYRTFFLIRRPVGRVDRFSYLEAVTVGNLAPVVYSRNDLSGALERGRDGRHTHVCVPGGEGQRKTAVKLAINCVMYSLTANYKSDQAHVKQLMSEGRLRWVP